MTDESRVQKQRDKDERAKRKAQEKTRQEIKQRRDEHLANKNRRY